MKVHVSMSLDGFTAGPHVRADEPMGRGGEALHEWLFADPMDPVDAEVARTMYSTELVGAVVMGRRHFEVGIGPWGDDGTFGMPCFVVTHRRSPPVERTRTTFEFVTGGLGEALRRARAAAGDREVKVMGAEVTRQLLLAGLVEEIEIDLVPVLLGGGASLPAALAAAGARLRQLEVRPSSRVVHVRYALTPS